MRDARLDRGFGALELGQQHAFQRVVSEAHIKELQRVAARGAVAVHQHSRHRCDQAPVTVQRKQFKTDIEHLRMPALDGAIEQVKALRVGRQRRPLLPQREQALNLSLDRGVGPGDVQL